MDGHERQETGWDVEVSYWPAVAALSAVVFAVGLTVSAVVASISALVLLVSVMGWIREFLEEHGRLKPISRRAEEADAERWWRRRTRPWWGAFGYIVVGVMLFAVALRAFVSYDLIGPENWPAPAEDVASLLSMLTTLVLLASGGTAAWAARAHRKGDEDTLARGVGATLILGGVFLLGIALQWMSLYDRGFTPWETSAGSLFYWTLGLHATATLLGMAAYGILLHRLRREGGLGGYAAHAPASGLWWGFLVVTWLVLYVLLYLRVLHVEVSLGP